MRHDLLSALTSESDPNLNVGGPLHEEVRRVGCASTHTMYSLYRGQRNLGLALSQGRDCHGYRPGRSKVLVSTWLRA
jgi:hypothetical protein